MLRIALAFVLAILLVDRAGAAATPPSLWQDGDSAETLQVKLHFFWTRSCPHCVKARPFVAALARERPWLQLHSYDVTSSAAAQELFALTAAAVLAANSSRR